MSTFKRYKAASGSTPAKWEYIASPDANELPPQTGHSGKFLSTNGVVAEWKVADALPARIAANDGLFLMSNGASDDPSWESPLPAQTGNSGKYLTTDGTDPSWSDPFPAQTGMSGKVLTTDGSSISWAEGLPAQAGMSGKVLTTNGTTASWAEGLPSQTGNADKFLRTNGATAVWEDLDDVKPTQITTTDQMYIGGYNSTEASNTYKTLYYDANIYTSNAVLFGAAWNDFAEYRKCYENLRAGFVVKENGDDTVSLCNEDCAAGCKVISDTYGMLIGDKEDGLPIAVAGRVLVYTQEPREAYKYAIGRPVCSATCGCIRIMTDEEASKYPYKIIGTVSSVPTYEEWGTGRVAVDDRVWIQI